MCGVVIFLTEGYGGAEQRLARIFNDVARKNLDVDLIFVGNRERIENFIRLTLPHCVATLIICKNTREVVAQILRKHYQVIHFFDSRLLFLPILFAAKAVHTKLFMTIAYTQYSMLQFKTLKIKLVFHCVVFLSDFIDVLYPSSVKKLRIEFPKKHITATPNSFTDLERFTPSKKEKLIVFLGRLEAEKNSALFLDSIEQCQHFLRANKYRIVICGNGSEFDKLVRSVEEKRLKDLVQLSGFVDPQIILSKASIFVSLQQFQNYPSQSLLEAISSGCYIIASNVGDTSRIVKSEFGNLVNLDAKEISEALKNYISKDERSKKLISIKARNFAVKNFQIDRSSEYFKRILLKLGEISKRAYNGETEDQH